MPLQILSILWGNCECGEPLSAFRGNSRNIYRRHSFISARKRSYTLKYLPKHELRYLSDQYETHIQFTPLFRLGVRPNLKRNGRLPEAASSVGKGAYPASPLSFSFSFLWEVFNRKIILIKGVYSVLGGVVVSSEVLHIRASFSSRKASIFLRFWQFDCWKWWHADTTF